MQNSRNMMDRQLLRADEVMSKSLACPWSHDIHVQLPTVVSLRGLGRKDQKIKACDVRHLTLPVL